MNLFIESFEGDIYLAYTEISGERDYIKMRSETPHRFHSISQIREHLHGAKFDDVWLKHKSAYDEMIGLPGANDETIVPLNWH